MSNINDYSYQRAHDRYLAASVFVAAIVSVMAFNPAKMTVDVQPLSKRLQNGKYETPPPVLGVPVSFTRSGGFVVRPWIKPGDVGVVIYMDHDIDRVMGSGKEEKPPTERNHSPSDAVFVGGIVAGGFSISGLPAESLVLATESGSSYVAVTSSGVEVCGDLQVNGKITATGDIVAESRVSGAHHIHPGDSGGVTGPPQ